MKHADGSSVKRFFGSIALLGVAAACAMAEPAQNAQRTGRTPPATQPADTLANVLARRWPLEPARDLRNPVLRRGTPADTFCIARTDQPVTFEPVLAIGIAQPIRAGWHAAAEGREGEPGTPNTLWTCRFVPGDGDVREPSTPDGTTRFEPGDVPFGLFAADGVFSRQGASTQRPTTARWRGQGRVRSPRVWIYPDVDAATARPVPNSYLVCWEALIKGQARALVARVGNVKLQPGRGALEEILAPDATVRKLAGGFKFVEGPAWDFKNNALYFSEIPPSHIIRYADGQATVANSASGKANGLMFDRDGKLVACEGADADGGRRISRAVPGEPAVDVATHYQGKRFNSPNDLWLDAAGGIYFTDPRYGPSDDMEMETEAVYYVSADGNVRRIIDDLVKPNGIALSPDGRWLYVLDNGADALYRYRVRAPGRIGPARRIAYVNHPDGMTVDVKGRLYVTTADGVVVLRPHGGWVGTIPVPEVPANCTFGGQGNRTLFITARTSLYAIDTQTRGWHVHLDGPPPPQATQPARRSN